MVFSSLQDTPPPPPVNVDLLLQSKVHASQHSLVLFSLVFGVQFIYHGWMVCFGLLSHCIMNQYLQSSETEGVACLWWKVYFLLGAVDQCWCPTQKPAPRLEHSHLHVLVLVSVSLFSLCYSHEHQIWTLIAFRQLYTVSLETFSQLCTAE